MNNRIYTGRALEEQDALTRRQHIHIVDMHAMWEHEERRERRRRFWIAFALAVIIAASAFTLGYVTGSP